MKNKQITDVEIWSDDKLGREEEALHLLRFLENKYSAESNSPFVLNIDSGWGNGKTFFINHFARQLRSHGYPVVVFDAWTNDFSDQALLSFISSVCFSLEKELELDGGTPESNKIKQLKDYGVSLLKPSLPILLAALVKQLTGMSAEKFLAEDSQDSTIEGIQDLSSKISAMATTKALELHNEKKKSTKGFIKTIGEIVSDVSKNNKKALPIFIFVDELDRCRPSFSIELLENIKHLFSASGVYFIVSTDTVQLSHSIKAIYGAGFDSHKYLKRFFDSQYHLKTPKSKQYVEYLFKDISLKNIFIPDIVLNQHKNSAHDLFSEICDLFVLSARDMKQIFELTKTCLYLSDKKLHFIYLLFVACMQHKFSDKPDLIYLISDSDSFKQLYAEMIRQNNIIEQETVYTEYSGGNEVKRKLKDIFLKYINAKNIDLSDYKTTSSLGTIERQIVIKLAQDNNVQRDRYLDDPCIYDTTLVKYLDLIQCAGRFSS